jgi:phosphotransferase system enzyme I (PtsI)
MTMTCLGIGIGVSNSIAMGKAYLLARRGYRATPRWVQQSAVEAEVERFQQALASAARHLKSVRRQIPESIASDITAFIDTHLLMLEDSALTDVPIALIREQLCGAEWALQIRRDALVRVFDEMDDPYLRTRKNDVDHVVHQIQKILFNHDQAQEENLEKRVILAPDLTPADTILMRHQGIAAFVTEYGSPMSHTAILARSLGIPAVVGVRNVTRFHRDGEQLVVDGRRGVVIADADEEILAHFRHCIAEQQSHTAKLRGLRDQPAITIDGESVSLMANIELPEDIETTRSNAAGGVGLYRTEFLYMNRGSAPDEEEHLRTDLAVVQGLGQIPVTIRTLDLGADKQVDGGCPVLTPPACNPALGLRAIRLCLKEPDLFKPQLRAILRASAYGPVRIMIPMLSNLDELHKARRIIEETKLELTGEGIAFDSDIPVGGMIEVPAAALSAASFARYLDFLSIGTNDLIQYTLAIDRVDDQVNYLFDPLHPAVLRLIKMTIDAAHAAAIPVSMCGEMAGDPRYTRLLLGMGLRTFSMQPDALLDIKHIVRLSDIRQLSRQATELFQELDTADVGQMLEKINVG